MSSSSTCLNIVTKYLSNTFYNRINFTNPNIGVYYNSFMFDIITVIPYDYKDSINEVRLFSDYISLISEATAKIDDPNSDIGIIYVDSKSQSLEDSINIARLPALQQTDIISRKELLTPFLRDIYFPFWVHKEKNTNSDVLSDQKNLSNAKEKIEQAILNYCNQNNISRSDISSCSQFIDHIAPDIFKCKMTVTEEMQLRKEAELVDKGVKNYPDVLLKAINLLGLEKQ